MARGEGNAGAMAREKLSAAPFYGRRHARRHHLFGNAMDYFISCEKERQTRKASLQYRCSLRGF